MSSTGICGKRYPGGPEPPVFLPEPPVFRLTKKISATLPAFSGSAGKPIHLWQASEITAKQYHFGK
jgi:hypothetical protein